MYKFDQTAHPAQGWIPTGWKNSNIIHTLVQKLDPAEETWCLGVIILAAKSQNTSVIQLCSWEGI